jgi:hypothetical protein
LAVLLLAVPSERMGAAAAVLPPLPSLFILLLVVRVQKSKQACRKERPSCKSREISEA